MSIFASRTQKTIAVPGDEPHTVTIQKLAGRHLAKAAQEQQFTSVEAFKRMGGPAFQKEMEAIGDKATREELIAKTQADPLHAYDITTVLNKGIVGWSYEGGVTADRIDDLTEDAAEYLAREILRLSKPALFLTEAEAEADQKNDSSASTAS